MNMSIYNVSQEVLIGFAICFIFIFMLLMMNILNATKIKKLKNKYNNFMSGFGDVNIEELLETCLDKVTQVGIKNRELENQLNTVERTLLQCVQKIGIIRYNAFENVGSDLSFSIALLDNNDDGIVLSGIYSRESSSTYAKPIIKGKSRYTLSAEEIQALESARKNTMRQ